MDKVLERARGEVAEEVRQPIGVKKGGGKIRRWARRKDSVDEADGEQHMRARWRDIVMN